MADITNAQVVKWSNERLRQLADLSTRTYYAAKSYQTDYATSAIAGAMALAANGDVVVDGSKEDGRTPVTKLAIVNFLAGLNALVTQFETIVSGVGTPMTTIQNGIQVNGSPR
jgi:hypothetical protein